MKTNLVLGLLFALLVGAGITYPVGYYLGASGLVPAHTHGEDGHMMHEQMEAPAPIPSVDLIVHKDEKDGWNTQILLENFRFAPEHVSFQHIPGEGHAHIYVDGEKLNRVYGEWYHINGLMSGMHEISVRLSTNDHKELTRNGELIMDSVMIEAPETVQEILDKVHVF